MSVIIKELIENTARRVYLLTLDHVDESRFPTRKSFGQAAALSFGNGSKVSYFAVAKEKHKVTEGNHYHCAIHLKEPLRWWKSKKFFQTEFGVSVHYGEAPDEGKYIAAYRYITKEDEEVFIGHCTVKHPDFAMIGESIAGSRKRKSSDGGTGGVKAQRMKKLDVADYIRRNGIKTAEALMAAGEERRVEGDRALANFTLNLNKKARAELVEDAWSMHHAIENEARLALPRMTSLTRAFEGECAEGCNESWYNLALDVLQRSKINRYEYSAAVYKLFEEGRGKHRNIMLAGPSDCAKTFLLDPLEVIMPDLFASPAASTFSWLNVERAPAIFLNDFRWKDPKKGGVVDWDALLRLCDGSECNLPAPMNHFAKHIKIPKSNDVPIFATGPHPIRYWKNDPDEPQTDRHKDENEMMNRRWKVFSFRYQFKEEEKKSVPACGHCFAKLAFLSQE